MLEKFQLPSPLTSSGRTPGKPEGGLHIFLTLLVKFELAPRRSSSTFTYRLSCGPNMRTFFRVNWFCMCVKILAAAYTVIASPTIRCEICSEFRTEQLEAPLALS